MEELDQKDPQDAGIQAGMIRYLAAFAAAGRPAAGPHLDEDSLAAFTEGNLSQREARPILSHLIDCSFCRHVTAELVRLDTAFADTPNVAAASAAAEPAKVSDVLSRLLTRIFGTRDGAVFAHHEADKTDEDPEKPKDNDDSD
jgi:hypothetical protein